MFSRFNQIIVLAVVILGLCGWIWHQSQKIGSLKAENQAQAQTITQQSAVISSLKLQAKENQRLTLELSKSESEARSKSDGVIQSISKQVRASDAFNADAPSHVIEFLRE